MNWLPWSEWRINLCFGFYAHNAFFSSEIASFAVIVLLFTLATTERSYRSIMVAIISHCLVRKPNMYEIRAPNLIFLGAVKFCRKRFSKTLCCVPVRYTGLRRWVMARRFSMRFMYFYMVVLLRQMHARWRKTRIIWWSGIWLYF